MKSFSKRLLHLLLLALTILISGCATIAHKNIETTWKGYGATIYYKSTVMVNPSDIPAFIKAVDKLEYLLLKKHPKPIIQK